ncbi:MAG: carboxylating nicotinate-nucleotide diphosphorylase [Mycobacteriales bacterium]
MPAHVADVLAVGELDPSYVETLVERALVEDLPTGVDVTSDATIAPDATSEAAIVSRGTGVVAGLAVAAAVFHVVARDRSLTTQLQASDGDRVRPGTVAMTARGHTRDLLVAERTALNLLCHLSGIATLTARWVDAVSGTHARVRDTRKTTPGLRALEKYAVRCGGGVNHRMSLSEAALVKDNHVLAAGDVVTAYRLVAAAHPDLEVEVECDTIEQVVAAVAAGAEFILLDNMTTDDVRAAVEAVAGRARLEASGGLTLDSARETAATGIDFLAVGALTHSAPILDFGADLRAVSGVPGG